LGRVLNEPLGLTDQLWNVADATARSHGFQFDQQTEIKIRGLISDGVKKLTADEGTGEHAKVSKMIDDTVRFVEMMIQNSPHRERALTAVGPRDLVDSDFTTVKFRFCPCYPFC
jgi:hypothetical protein